MPLYHQRRFAKLVYSAASGFDLLQMLLHETKKNNLLVQSCKLYMECEFFFTELQVLSDLYYKVTLPSLNFVETSSQKDLLQILPALYCDLADSNMHTLDKYHISYKHLPVGELDSDLVKEILYLMCAHAAYAVEVTVW